MANSTIDFVAIIKRAYHYILKYKYLWLLGILIGGGGASFGNSGYSASSSDFEQIKQTEAFKNFDFSAHGIGSAASKMFGLNGGINTAIWVLIAFITFIVIVLAIYLSVTARGAIVSGVDRIDSGEDLNLSKAWRSGRKYFWPIFIYSVLICLIVLVPIIVLGSIVAIFAYIKFTATAIILGVFFLIIAAIFFTYLSLFAPFAERILILEGVSPSNSITAGYRFFNKNWKNILLTYLIVIAINIGASIALSIGVVIVVLVLGIIGIVFYAINTVAFFIYLGLALLAFLLIILTASGIIQSYNSTVYTIMYRELKKLS